MTDLTDFTFQQRSLFQQGYQRFTAAELKQLEWGLRFTPAVCSAMTALALYLQLPYLLLLVSALGIWAFFFPARHPMDLLYNHAVRHIFGAVKLPENPFQRRLACFAAGIMNIIAAALFIAGMPIAALVVGISLLVLQAIVIFTHFCTLSWMYEGVMRMFGNWNRPLELDEAKSLLSDGALLVDVRSPNEFAARSVPGAINLPLEELHHHVDTLKDKTCLLFCRSGARSHIAQQKLAQQGIADVFNVGAFDRAETLTQMA